VIRQDLGNVTGMTNEINKYAATMLPLFGGLVLAILAVLFTTGPLRIAAVVVLILLIVAIAALAGAEITRQRRANLDD
jgi:uncharacterized membrane protein